MITNHVRQESKSRVLLQLINEYTKTSQEIHLIEKSKQKSILQIESRFKSSKTNKSFIFPRCSFPQSQNDSQDSIGEKYNLHSQNQSTQRETPLQKNQNYYINIKKTKNIRAEPAQTSKSNSKDQYHSQSQLNKTMNAKINQVQQIFRQTQQVLNSHRQFQSNRNTNSNNNFSQLLNKIYLQTQEKKQQSSKGSLTLQKSVENFLSSRKGLLQNKSTMNFKTNESQEKQQQSSKLFTSLSYKQFLNDKQNQSLIQKISSAGQSPQIKTQKSQNRSLNKYLKKPNKKTADPQSRKKLPFEKMSHPHSVLENHLNMSSQKNENQQCKSFENKKQNCSPQFGRENIYDLTKQNQKLLNSILKQMTASHK